MLITLRQMQYVLAVYQTGSFSKAAEVCFAEQSTVSQQIKSMEEKLGVVIFDRNTIPIRLTPDGEIIIDQVKEIIEKVEELIRPFKTPLRLKKTV